MLLEVVSIVATVEVQLTLEKSVEVVGGNQERYRAGEVGRGLRYRGR